MKLGNKNSAGAPGGYVWEKSGDVVEVPDDFARELLLIQGAGFYEVGTVVRPFAKTPEPEPEVETEKDDNPHKLDTNSSSDLGDAIALAKSTSNKGKTRSKAV